MDGQSFLEELDLLRKQRQEEPQEEQELSFLEELEELRKKKEAAQALVTPPPAPPAPVVPRPDMGFGSMPTIPGMAVPGFGTPPAVDAAKRLGAETMSALNKGAAGVNRVFDFLSKGLASDLSKITGIPPEKLRGGLFEQLANQGDYWAERLDKEGFGPSFAMDVYKGLVSAVPDLAVMLPMGPAGLPVWSGVKGVAQGMEEGKPTEAWKHGFTEALKGMTFQTLFHAISGTTKPIGAGRIEAGVETPQRIELAKGLPQVSVGGLPSNVRVPAAGLGFAALEPGNLEERAKSFAIGAGFQMSGGKGREKKWADYVAEHPALEKLATRLTEHALKQTGLEGATGPVVEPKPTTGDIFRDVPSEIEEPFRTMLWDGKKKTLIELDPSVQDYKPKDNEILMRHDIVNSQYQLIEMGKDARITPALYKRIGELIEPQKPIREEAVPEPAKPERVFPEEEPNQGIPKAKLVDGQIYEGAGRQFQVARWDAKKQKFVGTGFSMGSKYEAEVPHPEDSIDPKEDIFVPFKAQEPAPIGAWKQGEPYAIQVNEKTGKIIPINKAVANRLDQAKTPKDIYKVLQDNEKILAEEANGKGEEYLDCDQVTELFHQALTNKNIAHEAVLGKSDEGSSHTWIRINGKNYDPTEQGFGDGTYRVVDSFTPKPEKPLPSIESKTPLEINPLLKELLEKAETNPPVMETEPRKTTAQLGTDESPSEKVEAGYTVNVQRAWHMEAKHKYPYTEYLGDVSIREALQNSLDAVIEALEKKQIGEGRINIDVADRKAFSIDDNGIGMSDIDIRDKFLALHGTGKDQPGRFGGFGIAKAVILAPTDHTTWELVTRDNYFNHELAQNRQRIQKNAPVVQGTHLLVDTDAVTFSDRSKTYVETTEYPAKVKVSYDGKPVENILAKLKKKKYLFGPDDLKKESGGTPYNTSLEIAYIPLAELDKAGLKPRLNGMQITRLVDAKTSSKLTQAIRNIYATGFEGALVVDITTKETPGGSAYPLTDSRMDLRYSMQEVVDTVIAKYSKEKLSAKRELVESRNERLDMRTEWADTLNKINTDPGYQEVARVAEEIYEETGHYFLPNPTRAFSLFRNLLIKIDKGYQGYRGGTMFHAKISTAFEATARMMFGKMGNSLNDFYPMLSKKVDDTSVRAEFSPMGKKIGLNLVGIDKTALKYPHTLALWMRDLIAHELTHFWVADHGQQFDSFMDNVLRENYENFDRTLRLAEAVMGKQDPILRRAKLSEQVPIVTPRGDIIKASKQAVDLLGKKQLALDFELEDRRGNQNIYEPEIPAKGQAVERRIPRGEPGFVSETGMPEPGRGVQQPYPQGAAEGEPGRLAVPEREPGPSLETEKPLPSIEQGKPAKKGPRLAKYPMLRWIEKSGGFDLNDAEVRKAMTGELLDLYETQRWRRMFKRNGQGHNIGWYIEKAKLEGRIPDELENTFWQAVKDELRGKPKVSDAERGLYEAQWERAAAENEAHRYETMARTDFENSKNLVPAYLDKKGNVVIGTSHKVLKPNRPYDHNLDGLAFIQDKSLMDNIKTAEAKGMKEIALNAGPNGSRAQFISLNEINKTHGDTFEAYNNTWGKPAEPTTPKAGPKIPKTKPPIDKSLLAKAEISNPGPRPPRKAKKAEYPDIRALGENDPIKTLGGGGAGGGGKGGKGKPGAAFLTKADFRELLTEAAKKLPATAGKRHYENPIRIFEELPFFKEKFYDKIVDGRNWEGRARKDLDKLCKSLDTHISKRAWLRVLVYAQGQQAGGATTLRRMGVKRMMQWDDLRPKEKQVYTTMRENLDLMFDGVNKARQELGLPPIPKVKDYFPFIRDPALIEKYVSSMFTEPDSILLWRQLSAPAFEFGAPRDPNAKLPFERNALAVFKEYMQRAIKYQAAAPAMASGNLILNPITVEVDGVPRTYKLEQINRDLWNYMANWENFSTQKLQPQAPTPSSWRNFASRINRNIGLAVLAFNVRSALIQPTQLRNVYIQLGEKLFIDAVKQGFSPKQLKFAYKTSRVLQNRINDLHVQTARELGPQPYQSPQETRLQRSKYYVKKGAYVTTKGMRAAGKVGLVPLQVLDLWAAEIAWLGSYSKATKVLGLEGNKAIIYADDFVTKYQASAALHDLAPIQRSLMGQLATIFQTFTINEWNMLSKDVFGIHNKGMTTSQRMMNIARLILSTAVLNYLFEKGLKLRSPFPCPEQALWAGIRNHDSAYTILRNIGWELSEQVPVIGGGIRYSTPYKKFYPAGFQMYGDVMQVFLKWIGQKNAGDFKVEDYATIGRCFGIAGTGQAEKMIRRMKKGATAWEAFLGIRSDLVTKQISKNPRQYMQDIQYLLEKYGE